MDTPLNKAHFCARKALHYSGNEKLRYLEQTIENFKLALKSNPSNAKAIESIELQIGYYEKQLKLLNLRRALCQKTEKHKTTVDEELSQVTSNSNINEHVDKTTDIQLDLLRNLEDSYKIIEELNAIEKDEQISSQISQLQNLNVQLNLMFHKLSISIEEVLRENELLRDKSKCVDDPKTTTACTLSDKDEFKKDSENSEQRDSDDSSSHELQDLPPLDLPTFNLEDDK